MPLDANLLEVGPANVYFGGELVGYLGDSLAVTIQTTVTPLTGAQAGTSPLNKVVTGGRVFVTIPLKEISATRIAQGILNSELVTGATSGTRIDIINRVGRKSRALSQEMVIKKLVGGAGVGGESLNTQDWIVIPECSPAESDVVFPFSPTDQREIPVTFEAWPDAVTGRWAYIGDENPI